MPEYLIHDNGGRPFKVIVSNNHVIVYKRTKEEQQRAEEVDQEIDDEKAYDKKMKRLYSDKLFEWKNVVRVFIGHHSPNIPKTWSSSDFVSIGNSILVHVKGKTYVSIGPSIYEFEAEEPITEYLSEIGNSDVPYPIAFSPNYAYLMIESTLPQSKRTPGPRNSIVRLKRNYIPNNDWSDVYAYFYGHKSIPGLHHLTRRNESDVNLSKKYAVVFSEINQGQLIATRELQGRFW